MKTTINVNSALVQLDVNSPLVYVRPTAVDGTIAVSEVNMEVTTAIPAYKRLLDFEIPQDKIAAVDKLRRLVKPSTPRESRQFDEKVRLSIYFGGQEVVCIQTPEGLKIVTAFDGHGGGDSNYLLSLSKDDRQRIYVTIPLSWEHITTQQGLSPKGAVHGLR
jgi:hypothetical protein